VVLLKEVKVKQDECVIVAIFKLGKLMGDPVSRSELAAYIEKAC